MPNQVLQMKRWSENNHKTLPFSLLTAFLRHRQCLLRRPSGVRRLCLRDFSFVKSEAISHYMTECCRLSKHLLKAQMCPSAGDGVGRRDGKERDIGTSKVMQEIPGYRLENTNILFLWNKLMTKDERKFLQEIYYPFISPCLGLVHSLRQSKILVACFTHCNSISNIIAFVGKQRP